MFFFFLSTICLILVFHSRHIVRHECYGLKMLFYKTQYPLLSSHNTFQAFLPFLLIFSCTGFLQQKTSLVDAKICALLIWKWDVPFTCLWCCDFFYHSEKLLPTLYLISFFMFTEYTGNCESWNIFTI